MTRDGRQVQLAGPDADLDSALAALRRLLARDGTTGAYTAGEAMASRLAHQEACHRAGTLHPDRLRYIRWVYAEAGVAFGAVPLADLTPAHVLDWLGRSGWSPSTRNVAGGMVRSAVRAALRMGKASRDPLEGLRLPRQQRREAVPTDDEILAARDAWPDQGWRDFVDLLRLTGARPSEIAGLTAAMLDRGARTARLTEHKNARHGKHRTILFPGEAWAIVERLAAEHPTGPLLRTPASTPWTRLNWRHRLIRRGIRWPLYSIRHRAHTRLIEAGWDARTVADLLGNSPALVLSVYTHVSDDRLRAAADRLAG